MAWRPELLCDTSEMQVWCIELLDRRALMCRPVSEANQPFCRLWQRMDML